MMSEGTTKQDTNDLEYEYRAYATPSEPMETFDERKNHAARDIEERFGKGWELFRSYPGTLTFPSPAIDTADGVIFLFRRSKQRSIA